MISCRGAEGEIQVIYAALNDMIADPAIRRDRERLLLEGVQRVRLSAYSPIAEMRDYSIRVGSPDLSPVALRRS